MTHVATIAISLVCLALAGFGLRIIVRQTRKICLGIRAQEWPHTHAKIKRACTVPDSSAPDRGEHVEVRYLYEVHGATYEGNIIHPCYPRRTPVYRAFVIWEKARGGRDARVSYDPQQPSRSTLSTGFYPVSLLPILGGLFMTVPGAGVATWLLIKLAGWQAHFEVMVLLS
jgi:hypothetical protein